MGEERPNRGEYGSASSLEAAYLGMSSDGSIPEKGFGRHKALFVEGDEWLVEVQQEVRRQKDQIWMLDDIRQAQIHREKREMKAKEQHEVEVKTVATQSQRAALWEEALVDWRLSGTKEGKWTSVEGQPVDQEVERASECDEVLSNRLDLCDRDG